MGQALSSHALLLAGTHVGGSDHAGTLGAIRMMIRGELASGARIKASSASNDDPRWRSPEAGLGVDTGFENGSAAE